MGYSMPVNVGVSTELGGLVRHIGRPGFDAALLGLFRAQVGASHLGLFVINDNRQIETWSVIDDHNRRETIETTRKFVTKIWPRDSSLFGVQDNRGAGVELYRRPAADITDSEYREICYSQPGVVDRLLMSTASGRLTLFLGVYRRQTDAFFNEQNFRAASEIAPTVLAACERNLAFSTGKTMYVGEGSAPEENALSARERQVTDFIAAGATSREIAAELGISHHTVLTYRKRIYEKLKVGTQRDLLARRYERSLRQDDQTA